MARGRYDQIERIEELIKDAQSGVSNEYEIDELLMEKEWIEKKMRGETNRLTLFEFETMENAPYFTPRDRDTYRPDKAKLVGGGAWVMIFHDLPVSEDLKPQVWGLYWATPCASSRSGDGFEDGGRYKVDVLVKHRWVNKIQPVSLFPHEYIVITDEAFEALMETNGYTLQRIAENPIENGLNLELIEKGRSLTEDERSIIWSLQVDGLPEGKACEEYFFSRHVEEENNHIWYMASRECVEYMENQFGGFRKMGVFY